MQHDQHRHVAFPPALTSAGDARHFVRDLMAAYLASGPLDIVELLTSEVVTNAVVHAGSAPVVEVAAQGGTVRVSVEDGNPDWPMPHMPSFDATSGRGMALVDMMADAWGVERLPCCGKRIWFEVRDQ